MFNCRAPRLAPEIVQSVRLHDGDVAAPPLYRLQEHDGYGRVVGAHYDAVVLEGRGGECGGGAAGWGGGCGGSRGGDEY
ncbi:hypothetical protein Q3G72_031155 [Acer saccharum]|nr:hypothetical protein Q3G72_031155 [Acer saccharum]